MVGVGLILVVKFYVDYIYDGGYKVIDDVLLKYDIDVIICVNDVMVFGVLLVVKNIYDKCIFEDICVIGFDDILMVEWLCFDFIIICNLIDECVNYIVDLLESCLFDLLCDD